MALTPDQQQEVDEARLRLRGMSDAELERRIETIEDEQVRRRAAQIEAAETKVAGLDTLDLLRRSQEIQSQGPVTEAQQRGLEVINTELQGRFTEAAAEAESGNVQMVGPDSEQEAAAAAQADVSERLMQEAMDDLQKRQEGAQGTLSDHETRIRDVEDQIPEDATTELSFPSAPAFPPDEGMKEVSIVAECWEMTQVDAETVALPSPGGIKTLIRIGDATPVEPTASGVTYGDNTITADAYFFIRVSFDHPTGADYVTLEQDASGFPNNSNPTGGPTLTYIPLWFVGFASGAIDEIVDCRYMPALNQRS